MFYDSILAKSFSKHEQRKLGYAASLCCLLIAFSFFTVLKPYLGDPFSFLTLQIFRSEDIKMLMINETTSPQNSHDQVADKVIRKTASASASVCSSMERTDFCDIDVDVRIHGESSSVFFASTDMKTLKIRPYARKTDRTAMNKTREWSINSVTDSQKMPKCTRNHNVSAILFSNGGYVGNYFHEFTDVVIPLFISARKFNGEVKFLVTNIKGWWIAKYEAILSKLSKYDIIDIDRESEVHCFPSAIIGLKRHTNDLSIDETEHSYSMTDFKEFLRSSYSLKRTKAIEMKGGRGKKPPQLLIIARRKTRSFTNTREISMMARRLGFKVIVSEPVMSMKRAAEIVNSCDVMMGVHGAGLTNMVFLPENAVLIQIVPFGGAEWVSTNFFGEPSKGMNVKYLEYKISMEESTLVQQYPTDHLVLRNPKTIQKQGWQAFKSVYLDKQNVNLDVNRFRPTLLKALELLH